ncbi:MAG: serine hydrolase domain-containing protein [Acidobacteriota bacterium]
MAYVLRLLANGGMALALSTSGLVAQERSSSPIAPAPLFPNADRRQVLARAFPEIDNRFRTFAAQSRVPGIAWGIVIDGELVHSGASGDRDVQAKAPVSVDTVFRIASMTKSFTAVAILRLRDEGRLSLDDPAERYIPELSGLTYPTSDSPHVTIRHLLSHAEGFPEDNPWGDRQLDATDADMAAMMRRGIPFSTAPGTAYEYSNFGFAILGRIVARVSGVPYADYVRTNILAPLGMTATTLDVASVPADVLAHGYRLEDGRWIEEPALPDGAFGPMGGMLTSMRDLAKYVGFLMSAWPPRDGPESGPIRRASAREMQQVWRPTSATITRASVDAPLALNAGGYGFGLRIWQNCSMKHLVGHSGGLPGFGSHMRWLPEHGVAIIALGNLTYTSWGPVVDGAMTALERTGGLRARVPQPSPALLDAREQVIRLMSGWDDDLANGLAADNLFLDEPKERRRAAFGALAQRHGACTPEGSIVPENALRGEWKMRCQRGNVWVRITLAPTMPPRVQYLNWTSAMPLAPAMAGVAGDIVRLIGARDDEGLRRLLGPQVNPETLSDTLEAAARWGTCGLGTVLGGDGEQSSTVSLSCTKGELRLTIGLDPQSGRLTRLHLAPAPGTCPE